MPRLITNKAKKGRKVPPCGRLIEHVEPHSPWQKLIDGKRLQLGFTFGEVAEAIGVHKGTFWAWLHNLNGFPHPKAFNAGHLARLAKKLNLKPVELEEALDASRHLYTARETPRPVDSRDALGLLIQILEGEKRERILTSYILNIARRLHRGDPPAPEHSTASAAK